MEQNSVLFRNKGMYQDPSVSKSSDEFAFKNVNIRITAVNDTTQFSVTNEKGSSDISVYSQDLTPVRIQFVSTDPATYKAVSDQPVLIDVYCYATIDRIFREFIIRAGETESNLVGFDEDSPIIDKIIPDSCRIYENYYYCFEDEDAPRTQISGTYFGKCIIGDYLVLFCKNKDNQDCIYRCELQEEDGTNTILATPLAIRDDLNFYKPIEAVGSYEREDIIKVYWVDGVNPNRVINIMAETQPDSFDFLPDITDFPSAIISKSYGGNGKFPSGVIQYFASYYNKLGQETKIVWASDLQYISPKDRGGKADEIINISFTIELSNIDTRFEYLRIYSAKRTSIDGPIDAQIVGDYKINKTTTSIVVVDNNINQASIDATMLYYIGGDSFTASTIEDKDGVLFFGDINIDNKTIVPDNIKNAIMEYCIGNNNESNVISFDYYDTNIITQENNFSWNSDFPKYDYGQSENTCFKNGETYRFAIQLQSETGEWSQPIFIGDKDCNLPPKTIGGQGIQLATAKLNDVSFLSGLTGYYKYRILMAETSSATRRVIAQGVVNPTVFNILERYKNSPSFIASWFLRGMKSSGDYNYNYFGMPSGQHYDSIYRGNVPDSGLMEDEFTIGEIQNIQSAVNPQYSGIEPLEYCEDNVEQYYIDRSVVTMNSPEISYSNVDNKSGLTFSLVGVVPISNIYSDFILEWENSHDGSCKTVEYNRWFYEPLVGNEKYPESLKSGYIFESNAVSANGTITDNSLRRYKIYAWHKSGSIVGQTTLKSGQQSLYDTLKHKIFSNFIYSSGTYYFNSSYPFIEDNEFYVFDSEELSTIRINNKQRYYYGNYDKLATKKTSYKTEYSYTDSQNVEQKDVIAGQTDPIRIKYKTTKHGVVSFVSDTFDRCLPGLSGDNKTLQNAQYPWGYKSFSYGTEPVGNYVGGATPVISDYVMLGEIIDNNLIPYDNPTEENLSKINWIPISEPKNLDEQTTKTVGDTYFKRWDCLRTYPWTESDENSVVDIVSFMVETHINLDGRCDINRGYLNQLNARPTNYGLMNDVYNQQNNIFKYNILDDRLNYKNFPNQFAWSKNKADVSDIDIWTSTVLSNTVNVDGKYGKINAIEKLNDTLVCFQDKAVCVINFNNRTQISTEQGLPIELANSGKVNGVTYLTTNYGCKNKYSIVNARTGLYFIDDENRAFIRIGKDGIADISTSSGMSVWFNKANRYGELWNGGELTNTSFVLQYDSNRGDIYIMTDGKSEENCIVYNETLGTFTSFFGYKYPLMWNRSGDTYCFCNAINEDIVCHKLFGSTEYGNSYSIDYRVNPEPLADKIFTNIEYIADTFNNGVESSNSLSGKHPFNKLRCWNEYQESEDDLTQPTYGSGNLQTKFRIRRVNIPRPTTELSPYGLDRMRNPWIHLKLSKEGSQDTEMMEFHSLAVKYFKQ